MCLLIQQTLISLKVEKEILDLNRIKQKKNKKDRKTWSKFEVKIQIIFTFICKSEKRLKSFLCKSKVVVHTTIDVPNVCTKNFPTPSSEDRI